MDNLEQFLTHILNDLLAMKTKADNAPCASDQHWCSAIESLVKLLPSYTTANPEYLDELEYVRGNQTALRSAFCSLQASNGYTAKVSSFLEGCSLQAPRS